MGSFANHLKYEIEVVPTKVIEVAPIEVKAQYNPDRFRQWQSLHVGGPYQVLNIAFSPHVYFLTRYEETGNYTSGLRKSRYYKMHRLYGKKKEWIEKKAEAFIALYEFIKGGGEPSERISILRTPIVPNIFNKGYEVYEGHHRLSIYYVLDVPKIKVDLLTVRKK